MSELRMKLNIYIVDFLGSSYLRRSVIGLLVVCLGLLVWSMAPSRTKPAQLTEGQVTVPTRVSIGLSTQRISTAHLFGQAPGSAKDATPAVTAASITVQGLFSSDDKGMAWAILDVDGKSGIFKAGDTLPDGEKLAAVGINAVQIANGPDLRVVEMAQTFGPASGIQLQGEPDLYAQQESFPGQRSQSAGVPVVQRLRPVSLPQNSDPISQMQALRQQLIGH